MSRASVALLLFLLAGCSIGTPAASVDLIGTSWTVVEIEGEPLPAEAATITFGDPFWTIVETPCRRVPRRFTLDDSAQLSFEGAQLSFDNRPLPSPDCSGHAARVDSEVLKAVAGVEQWRVNDEDHITLRGSHELLLRRVEAGR